MNRSRKQQEGAARVEAIATAVMAVAAVLVASSHLGLVEWKSRATRSPSAIVSRKVDTSGVARYAVPTDNSLGVSVFEVLDLECPFCASYARTSDSLESLLGDSVSVRYVSMQIAGHRFAEGGAVALECAAAQAAAQRFARAVLAGRDSIGLRSWGNYARQADVADSAAFARCQNDPNVLSRVRASDAAARAIQVPGTPTVILGDAMYSAPPTVDRLLADVRNAVKRR